MRARQDSMTSMVAVPGGKVSTTKESGHPSSSLSRERRDPKFAGSEPPGRPGTLPNISNATPQSLNTFYAQDPRADLAGPRSYLGIVHWEHLFLEFSDPALQVDS